MSYRLGIDIGSTTIKMALIAVGKETKVLRTMYRRHNAAPTQVGSEMLKEILSFNSPLDDFFQLSTFHTFRSYSKGDKNSQLSIAITGSVGMGYASRLNVPFRQEVLAAAEVVKQLYPDVHTLVDICGFTHAYARDL